MYLVNWKSLEEPRDEAVINHALNHTWSVGIQQAVAVFGYQDIAK